MKNTVYLLCSLFVLASVYAQNASTPSWTIQTSSIPSFIDFSPSDKFLVLENESSYEVWDTAKKSKVLIGAYRNKVGHYYPEAFLREAVFFSPSGTNFLKLDETGKELSIYKL